MARYSLLDLQLMSCNVWGGMASVMADAFITAEKSVSQFTHGVDPVSMSMRIAAANLTMTEMFLSTYPRQPYNLPETKINGETVKVMEEYVDHAAPFGPLLHFRREGVARNDPKVLIVPPLSGHHPTFIRDEIREFIRDSKVFVPDWQDAQDIPESDGRFDLDTYRDALIHYIKNVTGPDVHIVAICQSTVPVLMAAGKMAAEDPDMQPLSMTLKAGPIDVRRASGKVSDAAENASLKDFERFYKMQVSPWRAGAGREVHAGIMQLFGFYALNPELLPKDLSSAWHATVAGDYVARDKKLAHNRDFRSTLDLAWEFVYQTMGDVFIAPKLPDDPNLPKITKPFVFTVEGETDYISPPGQTIAAHAMLPGVPDAHKSHHLQNGTGHYGVFAGSKFREQIAPRTKWIIREAANAQGIEYDSVPAETELIPAKKWDGKVPPPKDHHIHDQPLPPAVCTPLPLA